MRARLRKERIRLKNVRTIPSSEWGSHAIGYERGRQRHIVRLDGTSSDSGALQADSTARDKEAPIEPEADLGGNPDQGFDQDQCDDQRIKQSRTNTRNKTRVKSKTRTKTRNASKT